MWRGNSNYSTYIRLTRPEKYRATKARSNASSGGLGWLVALGIGGILALNLYQYAVLFLKSSSFHGLFSLYPVYIGLFVYSLVPAISRLNPFRHIVRLSWLFAIGTMAILGKRSTGEDFPFVYDLTGYEIWQHWVLFALYTLCYLLMALRAKRFFSK